MTTPTSLDNTDRQRLQAAMDLGRKRQAIIDAVLDTTRDREGALRVLFVSDTLHRYWQYGPDHYIGVLKAAGLRIPGLEGIGGRG